MRRAASFLACAALLAGCGSDEPKSAAKAGERPANAPPRAREAERPGQPAARRRRRRLRRPAARAAGLPGRGEQVGLLVRALPRGVPVLPEAGARARREGRLPRRGLAGQRRRRPRVPGGVPGALPELQGPRPEDRRRARRRRRLPDAPPSTTRRASWPTCTRAATPARRSWSRTSSATPAEHGSSARPATRPRSTPRSRCASGCSATSRACRPRPTATAATARRCTWWPSRATAVVGHLPRADRRRAGAGSGGWRWSAGCAAAASAPTLLDAAERAAPARRAPRV